MSGVWQSVGHEALPLWDTFEVSYFFVAGLSIGVLLGFFFPSVWRMFRRSFRSAAQYGAENFVRRHKLKILQENEENGRDISIETEFIRARNAFQEGRLRDAVQAYLTLLTHEKISKQATNQAMFELAQVYAELKLFDRAFDMAYDLLSRKPRHKDAFIFLVDFILHTHSFENVEKVLKTWKGENDFEIVKRQCHLLCAYAEYLIAEQQIAKGLDFVHSAIYKDAYCARARLLVWQETSKNAWKRILNTQAALAVFVADIEARLRIWEDTRVSPMAGYLYFAEILENFLPYVDNAADNVWDEFVKYPKFLIENTYKMYFESMLVLSLFETERFKDVSKQKKILSFLEKINYSFIQNETFHSSLARKALCIHKCFVCGSYVETFLWRCPLCQSFDSMNNAFISY